MTAKLSPQTLLRYSRQIRLPGIGVEGQQKLLGARVLLIGMGALGSPAAMYLAAAGVGTLGLADFDSVEAHNLQRQIIHSEADIGRAKLESAAEALRAINPAIQLELHPQGITTDNAVTLIGAYDLVIDGSDNFPTRYLVNDAAFLAGKPLVYGSIFQFEGQLSVFDPRRADAPCYRCLFPQMPEPGTVPNCEEAGVFGALPGVVGSFQAMEAIKLITGVGKPLIGRLLVVDALTHRTRYLTLKKDSECPLCSKAPAITAISPANYEWSCTSAADSANAACNTTPAAPDSAALQNGGGISAPLPADAGNISAPLPADATQSAPLPVEIGVADAHALSQRATAQAPVTFIDVREPFEYEIGHIEGAQLIPLSAIADAADALPKDHTLLLYCHHGMRSLRAAQFLRQHGYASAASIRGGIDAWSRQIDPSIPRY